MPTPSCFTLYGFFINSFVINLVTTPGGVESLGASTASNLTFAAIALGFFVLQAGLLFVVARLFQVFGEPHWVPRRLFSGLMVIFAVMTVGERMVYAYGTATGVTSISALTVTVPYYLGMTARTLLSKVGVKVDRKKELAVSSGALNYPLNPLVVEKPAKPLNIVWLVAESLLGYARRRSHAEYSGISPKAQRGLRGISAVVTVRASGCLRCFPGFPVITGFRCLPNGGALRSSTC